MATKGIPAIEPANSSIDNPEDKPAFGPHRTRLRLFWTTILPQYVVPLLTCTSGAMVMLAGLAPTLEELNSFRAPPAGR